MYRGIINLIFAIEIEMLNVIYCGEAVYPPPPACISYALVQATVGVGTVLIWDLTLIR